MKKLLIIFVLLLASLTSYSQQLERYYRNGFATIMNGQQDVRIPSTGRRVDIVTDTFAIEVDFAEKWSQSVGQTLYYSEKLNKKAGILLVVNGMFDDRYVKRLMSVAYKHNITVWIMDYNNDSWGKVDVDIKYIY